ncbi:choice-of-anchor J domain-containing protein, partial [Flavobacterium sp.]|uniref:choice-of-anchor J domain-containing protein n=1 Tax=Flavobacterium sp. TaxID=239 RepID=UPI00260B8D9E
MKKIIFILTLLLSLNGFAQFPIPGTEGFESTTGPDVLPSTNWSLGTGNWAVFDNGVGLTQRWGINNGVASPPLVYAGTNAAYINRENIGLGNTSEDYLATPLVTVPANGQLRFFARTFSTGNTGTLYQIKVAPSTATQTNPAAYTTQLAEYNEDQLTLDMNGVQNAYNIYTEKVISFPASMIGTQVYVAFVMKYTQTTTGISGDRWLLDNVRVSEQCLNPTGLVATGVLFNQASLSWANPSGATSWEIEVIPATATPTGVGIVYNGTLPYVATGLTPNTAYKYYVRAICPDNIPSEWVGPTTFSTTTAPPVCGGNYLDPGGTGNYADNITAATGTTTICPVNATDLVTVTFTSFSTEGCCDFLSIYNGNSSSAPLIGTFSGTTSPGIITSTVPGGCLTFVFTTDGSVVSSGWVANVTCAPPPTCPKPTALATSAITSNSGTLAFTNNSSATNFEYLAVPCGSPAPTNG